MFKYAPGGEGKEFGTLRELFSDMLNGNEKDKQMEDKMAKEKEHLVDFTEETQVGWDEQGKPIKAEQLSCWVYEILEELAEQAKAETPQELYAETTYPKPLHTYEK